MDVYSNICNHSSIDPCGVVGHLKDVKRGYFSHAGHALSLSSRMIVIGLAGVVHAVVPVVFKTTMSTGVSGIKNDIAADNRRIRSKRNKR